MKVLKGIAVAIVFIFVSSFTTPITSLNSPINNIENANPIPEWKVFTHRDGTVDVVDDGNDNVLKWYWETSNGDYWLMFTIYK